MQLDVKFQEPFSYSKLGLICLVVFIVIVIIIIAIKLIKKYHKNKPVVVKPIDINSIKNNYLNKIENLKNDYNNKKLTNRKAYNELSLLIRSFIYETTKIDVRKYTLSDIKRMNMNYLTELVQEYYEPEFSVEGQGDFLSSLDKTKGVILKWQ